MLQPICRAVRTLECFSACASVFIQMKSTPSRPAWTMCETALPPPPPTPSTLMTALWLKVSISSNIPDLLHVLLSKIALKPGPHTLKQILHAAGQQRRIAARRLQIGFREQQEAHAGGM